MKKTKEFEAMVQVDNEALIRYDIEDTRYKLSKLIYGINLSMDIKPIKIDIKELAKYLLEINRDLETIVKVFCE